jgi:sulfur-oxidizing protein SoxY
VKAIHVFTEKNPQPNIISAWLGPRAGRAAVTTRARIADTGTVTASRSFQTARSGRTA